MRRTGNTMGRVLVSRQPICRPDRTIHGYELLFRDDENDRARIRNDDEATAQVIVNTFMEIGLQEMVGSHLAFINVSPNFLLGDFCEALPPDLVILELLVPPHLDPRLLLRVKLLVHGGYRIAVGDFAFAPKFQSLLEFVSIAKIDVHDSSSESLKAKMALCHRFGLKTVAEKVETPADFNLCKDLGFDWYQGYFFCHPQFVRGARIPLTRLTTLRLIGKLNDPQLTINHLEESIRQDLSLSYKLLRYVGSAGCGLRGRVQSIRHAAVLIGIDRLKIWASLILFSGVEDKMKEVDVSAIVRARMCEKLAEAMKLGDSADQFFLVGLFSLLDTMLSRPMEEIVESLNLTPEITNALLHRQGVLGSVLACVMAYERRDWNNVNCGTLDQEAIRNAYVRATAWSIRTLNGFADTLETSAIKSRA